jgi:transcriptional repressor NrdR
MKCPICHFEDTKVIDSRVAADGSSIRRRRECLECNFRFSTYEEVEILDLMVVKRDGRRESYNREKMVAGLKKALEKRNVSDDDFKKLVHAIERNLQALKEDEIPSLKVGQVVMQNLKQTDQVAYIRYASVYQDFTDAEEFKEAIDKLLESQRAAKKK